MQRFLLVVLVVCLSVLTQRAFAQNDAWVVTNGPYGGYMFSVVARGDTMLASTMYLERSTDKGRTWKPDVEWTFITGGIDSAGYEWGVNGVGPVKTFYYKRPGLGAPYYTSRSEQISRGAGRGGILVAPNGTRYILTQQGDSVLVNTGAPSAPWRVASKIGGPWRIVMADINPKTNAMVAVGSDTAQNRMMCRSTDGGDHWTMLGPCASDSGGTTCNGYSMTTDGQFYLLSYGFGGIDNTLFYRVARSTDDGATWKIIYPGLAPGEGVTAIVAGSGTIKYGRSTEYKFVVSRDNGDTWSYTLGSGIEGVAVGSVFYMGDSTIVMVGLSGGLFRSSDGGEHWDVSATGIPYANVASIIVDSTGAVFSSTSESGVYRTTDLGSAWTRCATGIPGGGQIDLTVTARGTILAGHAGLGMFRSTDHGASWSNLSTGLSSNNVQFVTALDGGTVIAWTANGVVRSTDDGLTWAAPTTTVPATLTVNGIVPVNDHIALVLTDVGPYRTSDGGETWTLKAAGLANPYLEHATVLAGETVIASRQWSLFRSTDGGLSWTDGDSLPHMGEGHPYAGAAGCSMLKNLRSFGLLACTDDADSNFWRSVDMGHTWTLYTKGMEYNIGTIATSAVAVGSTVMTAVNGGVYRAGFRTEIATPRLVPADAIAIVPNPVQKDGTVHVTLASPAYSTIAIFDILGRERVSVARHYLDAGDNAIHFDVSTLAPGTYVCRVVSVNGVTEHVFEVAR